MDEEDVEDTTDGKNGKGRIAVYHLGLYADKALTGWFISRYETLGIGKPDMGKSCIRFRNMDRIPYERIAELCGKQSVDDYIRLIEKARRPATEPSPTL